jgi:hypothetical protein
VEIRKMIICPLEKGISFLEIQKGSTISLDE